MKKIVNKLITSIMAIMLIVMSMFTIVGCGQNKLSTPDGIRYYKDRLEWNYVEGALEYIVNISGNEYITLNNYYDLSDLNLVKETEYEVKIKAISDGINKNNSDYSNVYKFVYNPTSEVIVGQEVTLTKSEVESIVESNDINSSYFGIGRSINAIEDEYATFSETVLARQKVFDPAKLSNLKWIKAKVNKAEARSITEKSGEEYYNKFNLQIESKFSAGVTYKVFSASVETTFATARSEEYKTISNEVFSTFEQMCGAELVAIDEYAENIEQYENALSYEFLNEAQKVTDETTAKDFIKKFGTHVVMAGFFGGKISASYYLSNSESVWGVDKSDTIGTKVSAGIKGLCEASTSNQWSGCESMGLNESRSFEEFSAYTIGGNFINASSIDNFISNYDKWIDFINNKEDYSAVMVDYADKSLIEVWELLPSSYSDKKSIIKDAFEKMAIEENARLYSTYFREKIVTSPIRRDLDVVVCTDNVAYNPSNKITNEEGKVHDKFKMGELVIYGCTVDNEDKYTLRYADEFSLKYYLLENPEDLPINSEVQIGGGWQKVRINSDTASEIYGCNDFNKLKKAIGLGTSHVKFTYKNGTNKSVSITDLLKDKDKGDYIEITSADFAQVDNIEKIEVVIVYELWCDWRTWNWVDFTPNIRTTYTYNFV